MSCRCGRHNNDKENAPLAQLVEHLTLNQGVQGSSPWRCTLRRERIVFGDIGALGTVLFLALILLNKLLYKAGNPCYIDFRERDNASSKTQKPLGCYPGAFCCQADCCYSSPSSHLHM